MRRAAVRGLVLSPSLMRLFALPLQAAAVQETSALHPALGELAGRMLHPDPRLRPNSQQVADELVGVRAADTPVRLHRSC